MSLANRRGDTAQSRPRLRVARETCPPLPRQHAESLYEGFARSRGKVGQTRPSFTSRPACAMHAIRHEAHFGLREWKRTRDGSETQCGNEAIPYPVWRALNPSAGNQEPPSLCQRTPHCCIIELFEPLAVQRPQEQR